jgi:hypothetical protein
MNLTAEKKADQVKIIDRLRKRASDAQGVGCFMCLWIVQDFDLHGTLTDYPKDANGGGVFPYLGKRAHIAICLKILDRAPESAV